jgi:hypothetical protein
MKIFTFIFLLTTSVGFGQTWNQLPYYFERTTQSTPKIFSSSNDILVAGISYNPSPESHISLDGGTTWQLIFADKPIISAEFGPDGTIYFISSKRYLTTSNYNIDTLFSSADGSSWTNMGYKLKSGSSEYDFTISANNTLLFPNYSNSSGKFFSKSSNNGVTWSNTVIEANPITCSHSSDTIITSFDSPWPGGIRYSHDGGASVNNATGISAGGTIPIRVPNGDVYAAAVGQVYKSTDGGVSFTQVPLNPSIVQIQEFLYGANGKFYFRTLSGIWETTDFTNVTQLGNLPDNNLLYDIDISDNYLYAVTDTNLYRLPLSTGTGISEINGKAFFEIYPNPVKDNFSIKSDFRGNILMEIYDLQGRMVISDYISLQKDNVFNYPLPETLDGLYLIQLTNDQGEKQSRKIIFE